MNYEVNTSISGEVIGFGRAAADMHLLFFFATFTNSFVKLLAGFWRLNNIFYGESVKL